MNKKALRTAGWALGLSMVVAGIGAVVGTSHISGNGFIETRAATQTITYTATGSGAAATLKNGDIAWTVTSPSTNETSGSARGLQYSKSAATFRFTPDFDVTGLTLIGSSNDAGQNISYKIGSGSSVAVATMTKTNNTSYVFANFSCNSGQEIVITISAGAKSTYVKSITLSYEASIPVESVTLDKESAEIYLAEGRNTTTLSATVSPNDASDKAVTWASNATGVATVADGVVTGVAAGAATITAASHEDANIKDTCGITVWAADHITITNPDQSGVKTNYLVGDEPDHTGLIATMTWTDGTNTKEEDITALAVWTDTGAPSLGDDMIIFNVAYGDVDADFELPITVAANAVYPTSVSLSYSDTTLFVGENEDVESTGYLPDDANQLAFGFSSSDPTVLSVDSEGSVSALKAGTATITYFSDYDGKRETVKATVDFTVENVPPTGITLSSTSGSIVENATETLDFTVSIEGDPTIPGFTAVAAKDGDNEDVVSVAIEGNTVKLSPEKAGTTTVTVSTIATPTQSAIFTVEVTAVPKFTLVTDITELTVGNKIIFSDEDSSSAMKQFETGNNCKGTTSLDVTDGVILETDEMGVYTIGADEGGYTLEDESGKYLYAAGTSKNYLKVRDSLEDDLWDHWNISIDSNSGIASVVSVGNTDRGVMQFNSSSTLFSCYETDSQKGVKIYVLNTNPSDADKVETFSQLYMHKSDIDAGDEATHKSDTEACFDYYDAAKAALDGEWADIAEAFSKCGDMWDRYVAWGDAKGEDVIYDNGLVYNAAAARSSVLKSNQGSIITIASVLGAGALLTGGFFLLRKKREN